ncbi:uncharacterized protein LOC122055205 [Zingiber officinale]|uniref:uncharacterized protein LOC122055205 n=1 Tax=Zingiber officinale TaxID=94328 RepID=UPI001C4C3E07|nr:uncharacterized protein LOC122055205 [Zingiber officinale]
MADKLLKDYAPPYARGVRSSITRPPIEANNFEIKPAVIHMVQQNQFRGGPHEDPNHYLELFYEICGMMKVNDAPPESVSLDSVSGGALMNKSLDEAEEIIENVAQNHHQWASKRSGGAFSGHQMKALGKFEVDAFMLMSAKLDALTKKFETMGINTANVIACVCDICGSTDHA